MGVCSTCAICGAIHDLRAFYDANTVEKQAIHTPLHNQQRVLPYGFNLHAHLANPELHLALIRERGIGTCSQLIRLATCLSAIGLYFNSGPSKGRTECTDKEPLFLPLYSRPLGNGRKNELCPGDGWRRAKFPQKVCNRWGKNGRERELGYI